VSSQRLSFCKNTAPDGAVDGPGAGMSQRTDTSSGGGGGGGGGATAAGAVRSDGPPFLSLPWSVRESLKKPPAWQP